MISFIVLGQHNQRIDLLILLNCLSSSDCTELAFQAYFEVLRGLRSTKFRRLTIIKLTYWDLGLVFISIRVVWKETFVIQLKTCSRW